MNLKGMIPPAVTPFDHHGVIDIDLYKRDVEYLQQHGVDGVGVAGSTGEGAGLTDDEIAELVQVTKEVVGTSIPVVAGIIRNSTKDALRVAEMVRQAGADALLVTPVPYSGATDEGNIEYFSTIATKSALPVIVYNVVPTNTITPALMRRIGEIQGVMGVKQVTCELLVSMVIECPDNFLVYSACDEMLVGSYMAGAIGAIAAIVTVLPDLCVRQWKAYQTGDMRVAEQIQRKLAPIVKAYASRPFPGKVKALINLQDGRQVGYPRAPVLPPSGEEAKRIRDAIRAVLE